MTTARTYVAITLAAPADAEVIIGNLPADIRSDQFAGPFVDGARLMVPAEVESLAWAVAADIEGHRASAWPVEQVHIAWLKAALADLGKLDEVNAAVASAGPVTAALWEYVTTIRIDDPDVVTVAGFLDLDLPDLFRRADAIRKERRGAVA